MAHAAPTRPRTTASALLASVLASVLAVVLIPVPAPAHPSRVGPSQTLMTSRGLEASVQAVVGPDGRPQGFANVSGRVAHEVRWFTARAGRWRVEATPYRGHVLSTAADATGSYLLYQAADGLRVTKRLSDGRYTRGHLLQALRPLGAALAGDLVADDGRWWAVWGEVAEERQQHLHEAGTFGGRARAGRVTGSPLTDAAPTLALVPGRAPTAVLVWLRAGHLWTAHARRPGGWRGAHRLGGRAADPDLVVAAGRLHLVWVRDGQVWYGEGDATGLRPARASAQSVGPGAPRLAVSRGQAFVVFAAATGSAVQLAARRSADGPWRTAPLWTDSYDWSQFSVTAVPGRLTVFVGAVKSGAVLVRTQGI